MTKFRSKPVEIEAVQFVNANDGILLFNGGSIGPMGFPAWLDEAQRKSENVVGALYPAPTWDDGALIYTLEGVMLCSPGDWIICGTEGEVYPCKPSVFQRKYEPI